MAEWVTHHDGPRPRRLRQMHRSPAAPATSSSTGIRTPRSAARTSSPPRDPRDTLPLRPSFGRSNQLWEGVCFREEHTVNVLRGMYPTQGAPLQRLARQPAHARSMGRFRTGPVAADLARRPARLDRLAGLSRRPRAGARGLDRRLPRLLQGPHAQPHRPADPDGPARHQLGLPRAAQAAALPARPTARRHRGHDHLRRAQHLLARHVPLLPPEALERALAVPRHSALQRPPAAAGRDQRHRARHPPGDAAVDQPRHHLQPHGGLRSHDEADGPAPSRQAREGDAGLWRPVEEGRRPEPLASSSSASRCGRS